METNPRNQNPITKKNLEDLILHKVLPKIPAKSILQFKTVSRHWNAFITSVEFLKTHVRHLPSLDLNCVLTLDVSLSFFQFLDYTDGRITTKKFRNIPSNSFDYLLSSCNGVVFMVSPSDADIHCRFGFDYVLYNPVLGPDNFVKIPHPDEIRLGRKDPSPHYGFGFGYVSSIEDYNIVAIDLTGGLDVDVNVYSLRSKRWEYSSTTLNREGSSLPLQFQSHWNRNTGTLIIETLHWGISQDIEHEFIFAYNLANPGYSILPYPNKIRETRGYVTTTIGLCCLNDCLCAWSRDDSNTVVMWMLKSVQGLEFWTKVFRIRPFWPSRDFLGFNKTTELFAVFGHDKILYLTELNCNTPLRIFHNKWNAVDYVPSLESVLAI